MYQYNATLHRVVDGDTVELVVDLGFNISIKETFRLIGINAPERFTDGGKKATQFLIDTLSTKPLHIVTFKDKKDKYGRYLVSILPQNCEKFIAEMLVDAGLAVYKKY